MNLFRLPSVLGPGSGWRRSVLLPVSGAAASLGHAPVSLPVFTLAGFAVACGALVLCRGWRPAALSGGLFGAGYFGLSLSWIVEPFLVHAADDAWMAPFALAGAAGGMSLLWGAAFAVAFAVGTGPGSRVVALAVSVALAGLIREAALTGFPWALPAYVWSESPVSQSLAWFGPHALSFLTVLASGSWLVLSRPWTGASAAAAGLAALWLAGEARLARPPEMPRESVVVRVVQPNVPQVRKWDRAYAQQFFDRLLALTAVDSSPVPAAVVWPETAATFLLREGDFRLSAISAAAGGRPAAIGIRRLEAGRQRNSLAVIGPGGSVDGVYDKRRLVPFGEYIPFASLLGAAGLEGLASRRYGGFTPGGAERFIELGRAGRLLALICYESIFPRDVRRAVRGDGMLQVTNDGWFGTVSGPQQHFAQARMRAVELGLPLIRAANTGISAFVDGKGRIVKSLPLGVMGVIDAPVPSPLPPTLYSRAGDLPLIIVIAAVSAGLAVRLMRKPR